MGEQWDDSTQSKEKIEASLVSKQEAAVRRERALAYAFSHQVIILCSRKEDANLYLVSYYESTLIREAYKVSNLFIAVEEHLKVCQSNVCGPKQLTVGLELVGALDGSKVMGGSEWN